MKNILDKDKFIFKINDKLAKHCKYIPNEAGVYLIYVIKEKNKKLVYIGALSKIQQNGTFL